METTPTAARLIGEHGQAHIRYELSKTAPKAMIQSLQAQHGLDAPIASPVLNLTDTLALPRSSVLSSLSKVLADDLLARIPTADSDALLSLLAASFAYAEHPVLGKVPLAIMARLPSLPQAYILELGKAPALLTKLPEHIKQQTWAHAPSLFRTHMSSALAPYVAPFVPLSDPRPKPVDSAAPQMQLPRAAGAAMGVSLADAARARFNVLPGSPGAALLEFAKTVGSSLQLYNIVLEEARAKYVSGSGGEPGMAHAFAALRNDILVSLRAASMMTIVNADPLSSMVHLLYSAVSQAQSTPALLADTDVSDRVVQEYARLNNATPLRGDLGMVFSHTPNFVWVVSKAAALVMDAKAQGEMPGQVGDLAAWVELGITASNAKSMMLEQNFDLGSGPEDHIRGYFPAILAVLVGFDMDDGPQDIDTVDPLVLAYLAQSPYAVVVAFAILAHGLANPGTLTPPAGAFLAMMIGFGMAAGLDARAKAVHVLAHFGETLPDPYEEYEDMSEAELRVFIAKLLDPDTMVAFVDLVAEAVVAAADLSSPTGQQDLARAVVPALFEHALVPLAVASPVGHSLALHFAARVAPAVDVAARSALRSYSLQALRAIDAAGNETPDAPLSSHARAFYAHVLASLSLPHDAANIQSARTVLAAFTPPSAAAAAPAPPPDAVQQQ